MKKILYLSLLVIVVSGARAQTMIDAYEYWVDNDFSGRISSYTTPSEVLHLVTDLDVNVLSAGVHVLSIRFKQSDGQWSCPLSQFFVKSEVTAAGAPVISLCEYWIDGNYASKSQLGISPSQVCHLVTDLDMTNLTTGLHILSIRFKQSDGQWSCPVNQFIHISPAVFDSVNRIISYEYWFNDDFSGRTQVSLSPDSIIQTADSIAVPALFNAVNTFNVRYEDAFGSWTYIQQPFYKIDLNITAFLQGLYDVSSSLMRKAQNEMGDQFPGSIADRIDVEIHESSSPYSKLFQLDSVMLHTDGGCLLSNFSCDLENYPVIDNGSYYVVVKHRNSIETWSVATPIGTTTQYYDFTNSNTNAYGGNVVSINGKYYFFGGDVNQDGIVDSGDMLPVDNLSSTFGIGYIPEDANGDGLIDSGDMIIVDNNSSTFIGVVKP